MRKDISIGLKIKEAVRKNVCLPTPGEERRFTVSRLLRASNSREGDSEMGLILYCGVAHSMGLTTDEIVITISVDSAEAHFKVKKFASLLKTDQRFQNKVKLINNYLRLKYGITPQV